MDLTPELVERLDVALNEATLLGAEVDTEYRAAFITVSVSRCPRKGRYPRTPACSWC
jgi:hypothetical protein